MSPLPFLNILRTEQDACHFAEDIFECISWIKNIMFWFKFHHLKFIKGLIHSKPALVEVMTAGLMLIRLQAMARSNVDQGLWYMVSLGHNELMK